VRIDEDEAYLFVAVDRASKLALAKVYKHKDKKSSCDFLKYLMSRIPYMIDIILTDNGTEFTDITCKDKSISTHEFTSICRAYNIEHRHTKVKHPWTNGQVERMNRTIKHATTKRFHYETMEQLQEHLDRFLIAYNTAKPLKALGFKTVLQFLIDSSIKLNYKFKNSTLHFLTVHYN
jgi:IS30 family transposase